MGRRERMNFAGSLQVGNGQDTLAYLRILSSKDKQVILSRYSVSKFRMSEGIIPSGFRIPSQVNHLWYLALDACRGVLSPSLGPTRSHLLHVYVTISLVGGAMSNGRGELK